MSETLTLVLTDVVDSTQMNSRLGDAVMASVWAAHDREARALMQQWHAREVGRSDGFLLLFDDGAHALGFAQGYARVLRSLPIPVKARIGVHTGPVDLRQNVAADVARGAPLFEVDGLALPLTARLMATAGGGQILVSAECRQLLQPRMHGEWLVVESPGAHPALTPPGPTPDHLRRSIRLRLFSQGHWRLKGIDDPVELFQAGEDHDDFAPAADTASCYRLVRIGTEWRPVRELVGNLPAERDPFVGRATALRAVAERMNGSARLVSLLGTGGVGKTRLSQHYAHAWLGEYPGGAWFCDLSAANGLQGILYAVAQALSVPMDKSDPVQLIGTAIIGRGRCLIILDNFEHVARHAEETLGQWLQRTPQARYLVTSREQLGIAGEHALVLDPMTMGEAEALMRERIAAAGVDLPLAPEDEAALRPLVELLDRLPLAIELAASRVRVMQPAELLARMDQRFKLLTARSGRHDRQATLRATLDWSWDLLTPVERAALAQTSVFEGGFTLGAAEAVVCVSASAVETWATDVVQALVEKSLIRRSGGHRFDLLRSVHEYAAQRLRESGEVARQAALRRHWLHFGTLDERSAIADRCIEAENLVAACRRATAALDLDAAATVLIAAWAALNLTGPFKVAIELAQDLYRAAHTHAPRAAMTARWVAGSARYLAGDITGAQADLEAATGSGGTLLLQARAYGALGQLERSLGRLERADELLVAGLAFAHQTGDAGLICRAYNALGTLRLAQGRLDDALHDLRVGLDAARSASDLKQQAALLGNIGVVERRLGRDDSALDHYRQALRMAQDIGDRRFEGNMRSNLGLLHQLQGRSEEALTELQIALNIAQGTGLTRLSANVCSNLGLVHERLQQTALALERHTEAMRLADGLKDEQLAGHSRIYAGRLLSRLGRLQEARATLHTAAELLAQSPDVSVLGLLACANAEVWAGFNDREASLQALHVAEQHARTSAVAPNSELAQELRRISEWLNSH